MNLAFINNTIVMGLVGTLAIGCSRTASTGDRTVPVTQFAQQEPERDPGQTRVKAPPAEESSTQQSSTQQPSTRNETPRAVGGGPIDTTARWTPDVAVIKIAAAQCNREVRCKDLGPGEKYASRNECVAAVESERRNQINEANCPRPISAEAMKNCLQALDDDDCESAMAAAARNNACQLSNLCVK